MSRVPAFLEHTTKALDLKDENRRFPRHHVFDDADIDAINAALAAGRPLLLRGRPGTGKSQLALAAAVALKRAYVAEVVDARTESRDLLWRFDAVRRLADAQVASSERLREREALIKKEGRGEDLLAERFYTSPGVLWWAFQWQKAERQALLSGAGVPSLRKGCKSDNGVVILLDEIDKADSSVPNGLLGVLGDGTFAVPGFGAVTQGDVEPLIVITTNEERSLPDAFLRRCAVHHLDRDSDAEKLRLWLERLGDAHFREHLSEGIRREAAAMVLRDRDACLDADLSPPGGAEYLDLLRAVAERSRSEEDAKKHLATARQFLVRKHPS